MKTRNIYIATIITAAMFFSTALFAQEKVKKEKVVVKFNNISESDFNDYLLPVMPFSVYNIERRFGSTVYSDKTSPDELNILLDASSEDYASIKSNGMDKNGVPYYMNFSISKGYYFDNRYGESLKFTSDLYFKSRNNSTKDVFTKELYKNESISNLSPIYSKNKNGQIDNIDGYEFNYVIKRSPTYRAVRTTTEILLACGLGVANYYATKHENMVDWQYKYSWEDAKQKVKDGWYWDPNNFNTNTLYHLYAGNTYYQIARSNDYTVLESVAWTVGGSFFWEFIGEWREQVSLNDMIFTPMLGALVGEALIQTTNYIEQVMSPSIFRDLLVLALNPPGWINKKLDSSNSGSIRVQLLFKSPVQTAIEDRIRSAQ